MEVLLVNEKSVLSRIIATIFDEEFLLEIARLTLQYVGLSRVERVHNNCTPLQFEVRHTND